MYAQEINATFSALDAAFARSPQNLGVFSVNASDRTKFLQFDNQYDLSGMINGVETASPILIGCFSDGGNGRAFTVVNCEDLKQGNPADVRIKTDAAVTLWQNGTSSSLQPDGEGYISLSLAVGEGVFCEIIK